MAIADVEREVKESVEEQLSWDERVLSDRIQVEVNEGVVKISGQVPNYLSRLAAEEDALSVIGVNRVENQLKVLHPDTDSIPGDAEIKKAIDNMLELDSRLDDEELVVEVTSGEVLLHGMVNTFWKKALAEEYTDRTKGVVNVVNQIKIIPSTEFDDEKIHEAIIKALQRNAITHDRSITVRVAKGEVTLAGRVMSPLERKTAIQLASLTSGVTQVHDNLD